MDGRWFTEWRPLCIQRLRRNFSLRVVWLPGGRDTGSAASKTKFNPTGDARRADGARGAVSLSPWPRCCVGMRYAGPPRFVAFERLRITRRFRHSIEKQGFVRTSVCTLQSFYHLKQINLVVYTRASRLRDESLNNIRPWRCVHYIQRVVCRHATRVKRGFLVTARSQACSTLRPGQTLGRPRQSGLASPASPDP